MITGGATAADFTKWTLEAQTLTIRQLRFVIADCRRAKKAMATFNTERELFYADQSMTFSDELRRRLAPR